VFQKQLFFKNLEKHPAALNMDAANAKSKRKVNMMLVGLFTKIEITAPKWQRSRDKIA
jgi:hypothetical protein